MRTHRMLRAAGLVVVVVVGTALAGCSSDGEDAADTPFGRALTEKYLAEGGVTSEEEARCVGGGIVDALGEDRLTELGFTPDDIDMIEGAAFTEQEITSMVDVYFDCVDVREVLVTNLTAEFGEDTASCVAENLNDDVLRDLVMAGNFGVEMPVESDEAFRDIATECGLPLG